MASVLGFICLLVACTESVTLVGQVGQTYVYRVAVANYPAPDNLGEACSYYQGMYAATVSGTGCPPSGTLVSGVPVIPALQATPYIVNGQQANPCGNITGLSGLLRPTDLWISPQLTVATTISAVTLCEAYCSALCVSTSEIVENTDDGEVLPSVAIEIATDAPYPATTFPPDVTAAPLIIDGKAPTVSDYAVFGVVSGSVCIFIAVGVYLFLRAH